MRKSSVALPGALGAALLLIGVRPAGAEVVVGQLTPKDLQSQSQQFQIQTRDMQGLKEFEVTIAPRSAPLTPFLYADLYVNTSHAHVAAVRVEGVRTGEKVTYRFRLAAEALANSRFELMEQASQVRQDEQGHWTTEPTLGGALYWFHPGDFAPASER